jgi:hypothetical protein
MLENKRILLQAYQTAELAILQGAQSYKIGTREITRAELKEVREERKKLENEVLELENASTRGGRRRVFRITPRDL